MSPFGEEESALPSRQCMGSRVPGTDGQIQWIPLQIASSSNIFARFSLRLFPVSKNLKKWFGRKRFQRAAHRRNRSLFWRVGQIILFRRLEKVVESLDQVYRAERRLCWEIKMNRSKKCVLLCFSKNLLTCSRTYLQYISQLYTTNIQCSWIIEVAIPVRLQRLNIWMAYKIGWVTI